MLCCILNFELCKGFVVLFYMVGVVGKGLIFMFIKGGLIEIVVGWMCVMGDLFEDLI